MPIEYRLNLHEGGTPLVRLHEYRQEYECSLFVKNECENPSGCFKDRGASVSINACLEEEKTKAATASSGNAAASLSLYAKKAGMQSVLFVPKSTPEGKTRVMRENGARIVFVDGAIEDAYRECAQEKEQLESEGARVCTAGIDFLNKEVYKTIAYEIAVALGKTPDWVIVPCGDGSNLSGIAKGFKELKAMGLAEKTPRMAGVQIKGGDPLKKGLERERFAEPIEIENPTDSLGDSAQASSTTSPA
ncbi:pyridoxal-phosphate dependent enzyme [Candidatus Micrarchaeota archaeon]|nr:pyridoxal-phosphate dependent enzyme [Candidatus Micrarchaeota archaeon]